jgi:tetratricopeptide (TPR) repeat protein
MVVRHEPRTFWIEQAQKLQKKAADPRDFKNQNDYAVALIHIGDVTRAMAILRAIEASHPGRSQTAANLGTGFELLGQNAEALKWIREGIRRDHKEHYGTEWLHVRILQAKIAVAADPRLLASHSVAGLDFGSADRPALRRPFPANNVGSPASVEQLKTAFGYQIRERFEFARPPDPVMGDLLFDWGNLLAVTEVVESADAAFSAAEQFSPPRKSIFLKRRQLIKAILRRAKH